MLNGIQGDLDFGGAFLGVHALRRQQLDGEPARAAGAQNERSRRQEVAEAEMIEAFQRHLERRGQEFMPLGEGQGTSIRVRSSGSTLAA